MTEDEFDERFTLLVNNLPRGACQGEERFETFGHDHDFISSLPPDKVWTFMEGDDGNYRYVPGKHRVNRIYYVVTDPPWTDDLDEVVLDNLNED